MPVATANRPHIVSLPGSEAVLTAATDPRTREVVLVATLYEHRDVTWTLHDGTWTQHEAP